MTQKTMFLLATALFGLSFAAPLQEREVPQEHSHEPILVSVRKSLAMDNPLGINDPVFGLLGDKGASGGAGKVTNFKCLQRKTADQAFTNAKAAKDIPGMTNALIYAALERNTGSVGKASDACDEPATNPEVNALKQHQDPASPGAAEANKALVLELARQIASVGGKPKDAALSATFAPGKLDDPTAKGNSCDDQDDPNGCIFTKKLIQVEATPEEIEAAVKSGGKSGDKSTEKAVQKRNQLASATNPEDRVKSTHRSHEFPEIIPRDIDRPVFDNDNENDNDNVKRDDNHGKDGKDKKKGGKGKKKGGKGKKKGGKGKKKGGKGKKNGDKDKKNGDKGKKNGDKGKKNGDKGDKGNKGGQKNNSAGSKE